MSVLDVGPVAHGGHFVARVPPGGADGGQVVFVRHALPGERVEARVTETSGTFLRADAVAVSEPSPDRVEPPCPFSGPGKCGGCDLQHVALPAQRRLKAAVVAEQMRRLAGLDLDVEVEAVPGDRDGLRWRTRLQLHSSPDGGVGLRRHRSHEVEPLPHWEACRIAHPRARLSVDGRPVDPGPVTERVRGRRFTVAADGFWQVHPGAPEVLVDAVLSLAAVRPGERVLDLYAGVGLFSLFLAEAVGPGGHVVAVEGDRGAAGHARANLASYPQAIVRRAPVDSAVGRLVRARGVDLVVLDPPRTGARRAVVAAVAALRPRSVVYVACDPAALARDVAFFADAGYRLEALRAFDLFPMTHHTECVALLAQTTRHRVS